MSISKKSSEDLFSFAYNLIPDDLEARQLVIDAIHSFLIEQKNEWEERELEAKAQVYSKFFYKKIFEIASKRIAHVGHFSDQTIIDNKESHFSFFKLSLLERAILFLRHRAKMNTNNIALITSLGKIEVINHLFLARFHLLKI